MDFSHSNDYVVRKDKVHLVTKGHSSRPEKALLMRKECEGCVHRAGANMSVPETDRS